MQKGWEKLFVLVRLSYYMSTKQRKILLKTFIESQFGYNALVWMFHSRSLNNKINHLYERALRIAYRNYDCS